MAEKEQVHDTSSNDESLEPRTSRSRRRFKASNMSFVEMVEMVDILKRADYDGKSTSVGHQNKLFRVSHTGAPVDTSGVSICETLPKKKRLGKSEVTKDPQPPKEGELTIPQPEDVEEGEVYEVGEIVTTTGDVDVIEEESYFLISQVQVHTSSSGRS
ncbi:hypothetical protein AB205_0161670 [Aquarana catesbeiana]|uniref:Uncharacterized protein n=1 Tax=Aquarana catesbeiana TaxID=8400 RepID=A0A2G9SLC4_AQUCT|nr:hypothetical protein AB205_0161670 [Aquarana catesbeiana]